jgi:perosamine synthetase
MPRNGSIVSEFEKALADYCGAKFAVCLVNGTATIHTALVALGVKPGDRVHTTPLTMSATTLAILQAGAVPVYHDINPKDWLMEGWSAKDANLPVSLYGLHVSNAPQWVDYVDDAAQTLRQHNPNAKFTSLSFQSSKILALGEGGALLTNDEDLATRAREFSSLGYRMRADQPRIDPAVIKSPDYERHHWPLSWNYRMNDLTATEGLRKLAHMVNYPSNPRTWRLEAANYYRSAFANCEWATPQYVPEGWTHDYWCYAVALKDKSLWKPFTEAVVRHGGEMPYGAWRLTYQEPAFKRLAPRFDCGFCGHPTFVSVGIAASWVCEKCRTPRQPPSQCPVAEDLQPRLVQGQTNSLESAERNAKAWKRAIEDVSLQADRLDRFPDATGIPCE